MTLLVPLASAHAAFGSHSLGHMQVTGASPSIATSITGVSSSTSDSVTRSGGVATLTISWDRDDGPFYRSGDYISGDNNQRWELRSTFRLDGTPYTPNHMYTNWNTNGGDSGTRQTTRTTSGTHLIGLQLEAVVAYEQRYDTCCGWGNTGTFRVGNSQAVTASITVV